MVLLRKEGTIMPGIPIADVLRIPVAGVVMMVIGFLWSLFVLGVLIRTLAFFAEQKNQMSALLDIMKEIRDNLKKP